MKIPKRCGNCGSENLEKLTAADAVALPWRDYPSVRLTAPIEGFKCTVCDELILSAAQAKDLDNKIADSVVHQVQTFITAITQREGCEQRQIAVHLGVSPEYLSEIKSGRKIPKFQTFNFLKTLAMDAMSFTVSDPAYQTGKRVAG